MSEIQNLALISASLDKEEQVTVLYALHQCGGKGSKARIIHFIIQNELLRPQGGDTEMRQTSETRIENDLAWARATLKERMFLTMPKHGVWQITDLGREKLFGVAKAIYANKADETWFERCNKKLVTEMFELGKTLSKNAPVV
jgi:restriction endonuclease Mrr